MSLGKDALFFMEHYKDSIQAKVQGFRTEDPQEIFAKGVYCLLTPATRAEAARIKQGMLLHDDFLFKASCEEIAALLRKPPYIRFHNQKAKRLDYWRDQGLSHTAEILKMDDEKEMRAYLAAHVYGMNFKEASHFLRNIGRGTRLAILDRHIIAFMKEEGMIPIRAELSSARYEVWESLFCAWAGQIGAGLPQADYAVWAAGVKKHAPHLSYEFILQELE